MQDLRAMTLSDDGWNSVRVPRGEITSTSCESSNLDLLSVHTRQASGTDWILRKHIERHETIGQIV